MVKVLFMGRLRDAAGAAFEEIELAASVETVADMRAWLSKRNPELGKALGAPSVRVAVDLEIVADTHLLQEAREIAFLPAFSGG
jgi:molybdopterin synthase sulfur carrier subunit